MAATADQRSFQANRLGGLRSGLLSGCAIAAVAMTAPAHGQAFNGTITSSINASQTATTVNSSTITVSARNALVNWTTSTPTTFLPTGNTVTYTNAGTIATDREFTVLNVVNSTSPITLNGTVNSLFNGATGGKVWFYNPGGIIAGPNAVFNVGGLLLTSNAINFNTGYGSYDNGYGTGNQGYGSYVDLFQGTQTATGGIIHFAGAQSDGTVTISGAVAGAGGGPGAVINANAAANSYVALVAPRVSQGGTVNVNGSAAYLALAGADVNINAGLFDITNVDGTQPTAAGETTLSHSGTTNVTTPANTTDAPRNIFLVAIPKNDAVTMLVGGTLGYAAATNATAVNGKIILDAGGAPLDDSFNAPDLGLAGNVTSTAATFNAPVVVNATGAASLQASTGDLIFRYGVDITSYGTLAELAASGLHTLDVGEYPATGPTSNAVVRNVSAGTARVAASGGSTLRIRHDVLISTEDPFGPAPSATKTAELMVAGIGTAATVGGTLTIDATKGINSTDLNQSAIGGIASIDVSGGSLTVTGATTLDAFGTGETGYATSFLDGIGGFARIEASGGIVTLAAVSLDASASAGRNDVSGDVGTATGGRTASTGGAFIASTGGTVAISGATSLDASATGGFANTAVQGGDVGISASGGAVTVTGATATTLTATASAGLATGGNASITTLTGGTVGLRATTVNVNGTSYGEDGEGVGYAAQGGTIAASANGGTITLTGPLTATANGTGANFRTNGGGDGRGGSAIISAQGGGVVNLAAATVSADGFGGDGFPDTQGGTGYGGVAAIDLDGGGLIATGAVTLTANGTGGTDASPATPGDGYGGTARVTAANSLSTRKADFRAALTLQANGYGAGVIGFSADPAPGGDGFGGGIASGTSGAVVQAGTGGIISVAGATSLQANGYGGDGAAGGNGGIGTGGSLDVATNASGGTAGTITLTDLVASTDGFGGDAETGYGSIGGAGFGGGAAGSGSTGILIRALGGGTINAFSIGLSSTGTGGLGSGGADYDDFQGTGTTGDAGGAGGNGVGGAVAVTSGGNLLITSGFGIQTDGVGGRGGDGGQTESGYGEGGLGGAGGNGTGGSGAISATGGIISAVATDVASEGRRAPGGSGGSGDTNGATGAAGIAAGGSIDLTVSDTTTSGSAALGDTTLFADGLDDDTQDFTGSAGVITVSVTGQASNALSFGGLEIGADGATAGSDSSLSFTSSGQAIQASSGVFISTTGNANFAFSNAGALRSGAGLTIDATGTVTMTNSSSATSVLYGTGDTTIDAAQIVGGSFEALNGDLELTGPNGVTGVTSARAGDSITASAENGAVGITTLIAGTGPQDEDFDGAIGVIALNDVTLGTASAYGAIGVLSLSGGVTATSIAAGQRTDDSVSTDDVAILGAGPIQVGSVVAPGRLYVGGPGSIDLSQVDLDDPTTAQVIAALAPGPTPSGSTVTIGTADSGSAQIDAGTTLTISNSLTTRTGDAILHAATTVAGGGALDIFGALNLTADTGSIAIGRLGAGGNATLTAGTAATTGDFDIGGSLSVRTNDGAITVGNGQAGTDLTLLAYSNLNPGDIRAGNITAGRDVFIEDVYTNGSNGSQSRSATLGNVTAGDDILIGEFGPVSAGTLRTTGLGQDGTAPPTPFASNLQGSSVSVFSGSDITIAGIQSAGSIGLTIQGLTDPNTGYVVSTGVGTISVGSTIAATTVTARDVLGPIDLRGITAPGGVTATGTSVSLAGAGDLRVLDAQASAGDVILSAVGNLRVDSADATGNFQAASGGTTTLPSLNIGGGITVVGNGGVSAQDLVADRSIMVSSSAGSLTAGTVTSTGGTARLMASQALNVGNVTAAGSVYLTSEGLIRAGDLSAGVGTLLPGEAGGGAAPAAGGIASGFDQSLIERCDDSCAAEDPVALPFALNYFGRTYSVTYVGNNGYVTFDGAQTDYTPQGLGADYAGLPIIAAFFADVDTRGAGSAQTAYGSGTYAGHTAFGATWNGVGYFNSADDKLNNFQIILTDRSDTGAGNFDIYYNYGNIAWETGDADGGVGGLGGSSAAVGYNAGLSGNPAGTYFELAGSRVPGSFINGGTAALITGTNDGVPGQYSFAVRNGQISAASEPATVHVSNIAAGNTASITVGNVSGEAVDIHGAGTVTTGTVDVGDRGTGIASSGLPFATAIQATGNLVTGTVNGTGAILLGSDTADVSTGSITGGASVAVLAGGNVSLGQVTTGTGATDSLVVGGPDALGGGTLASYVSGNTDAASLATLTPTRVGGTIQFGGPVSTGNLIAAAVGDITLGTTTVSNLLSLDTAGTARLSGQIGGPTLRVSSSDVVIDTSSETAIGNGTTLLEFTNNGTRGTYVGGGDVSDAWSLSNDEFGRLSAATITFNAPDIAQNDADLTIGDLDIIGGAGTATATRRQNLTASQLIFNSAGSALVNGAVNMTGAATDDLLAINAIDLLRVITPTGSIKLTGTNGALAGTLSLTGDVVFVGSQQAATDIAALGSISERSTRLGQNDGPDNPAGTIQANGLRVSAGSGFYIQNTGTSGGAPDTRAGFTVGSGGIDFSTGDDDVEVAINGRIDRGDGTILTGASVLSALFAQNDDFSVNVVDGSTINGCVIGASDCGGTVVPPPPSRPVVPAGTVQISDVLNQLTLLSSQTPDPFQFTFQSPELISFGDLTPLTLAPLIDEPVTGAGNEDLWAGIGYGTEPSVDVIGDGDGDGDQKKKKMKP